MILSTLDISLLLIYVLLLTCLQRIKGKRQSWDLSFECLLRIENVLHDQRDVQGRRGSHCMWQMLTEPSCCWHKGVTQTCTLRLPWPFPLGLVDLTDIFSSGISKQHRLAFSTDILKPTFTKSPSSKILLNTP